MTGGGPKNTSGPGSEARSLEKPADRRRSPRIEILGRLYGHIVSLDVPVTVKDISLHGLRMETPFAFPDGVVHEFRLMLGDGSTVLLRGRVVHSRSIGTESAPMFVSGVEFIDDEPPDNETTVGDLIDKIT